MDNVDLCAGFFLGLLCAGVLGFVAQRIRLASKAAKNAGSKQKVMVETKETPRQVVGKSAAAQLELILWVIVLGAIAVGVILLLLR